MAYQPPYASLVDMIGAEDTGVQQAHCPECNHNLGDLAKPHVEGCTWQRQQAEAARNAPLVDPADPLVSTIYENYSLLKNLSRK